MADQKISNMPIAGDILFTDAIPIVRIISGTPTNFQGNLSVATTLQGNVFNGTNQLVQLDSSGNLPAVPSGETIVNDPSTSGTNPLDNTLANIYTAIGASITNSLTSTANAMTSNVSGQISTAAIVNSVAISSVTNALNVTINGIASSSVTMINSNSFTTSGNTATSVVNGVSSNNPIINSVALSSSANTLGATINGIASNNVALVNNIALASSVNSLTSAVNGIASSAVSIINSNSFTTAINTATSVINGVTSSNPIVNSNSNTYNGNNLTISINGVAATAQEIDGGTILGYDATTGTTTNTVNLNASNANMWAALQQITNGAIWYTCAAQATTNILISSPGTAIFDGVVLINGQYLFLATGIQTSNGGADVGAYVFNGPLLPLTRVPALSTWVEIVKSNIAIAGGGVLYGDVRYYNANSAGGTIGTTPIVYNVWNTAYTGSATINLTGNSFAVNPNLSITSLTLGTALPITSGGTASTTQTAAITALAGTQTSGFYLRSNGTNTLLSAIVAADVPPVNNIAGGAANGVPYQTAASTTAFVTAGVQYNVLTCGVGGVPSFSQVQLAQNNAVIGVLGLNHGGTAKSLTASNGGIVYSSATQLNILAATTTANQALLSGASTTPAWSTATFPATTTINQLLYSSATNTIVGLATANSSILVTDPTGIPSLSTTLPAISGINLTGIISQANNTTITGMGYQALNATVGVNNTGIGYKALNAVTGTTGNTAVGYQAGLILTGTQNILYGAASGSAITSGSYNVLIGGYSGAAVSTASNNLILSDGQGNILGVINHASVNVSFGANSIPIGASGLFNVAYGSAALATLSSANHNTAIGYDSLNAVNADSNTAVGYMSGVVMSSGSNNCLFGSSSGASISTGSSNVIVGAGGVGNSLTTGSRNVFMGGAGTGTSITTASNNVWIGYNSGNSCTTSGNNFLGYQAGQSVTSGASNTYLGSYTGGSGSDATTSNQIIISDGTGNIGIQIPTSNTALAANLFLGTPNGTTGPASPRAIVAADIPTLNQNTTGTAANVAGGAVNQLHYQSAANMTAFLSTANSSVLVTNGSGVPSWSTALPTITGTANFSGNMTVTGGVSMTIGGCGYLNAAGASGFLSGGLTGSFSIQATNRVLANEFNTISDKRTKTDIITLDEKVALGKVQSIRAVQYVWNNGTLDKSPKLGWIAQEVGAGGIGEAVTVGPLGSINGEIIEDFHLLDKDQMTAVLWAAVRQLSNEIELLKVK